VVDLDGVIWLTGEPIAGAAAAVRRLRRVGNSVLFATNNSALTVSELLARLARIGIDAGPEDLVTSAQAAAALIEPGSRALVVAGDGVVEALTARGISVVEEGPVDVVTVGLTHRFDFDLLARASVAVRRGARLIGTNDDPTHPTPGGLLPGTGSLLAAVSTAAGVVPLVAGKPYQPLASLVTAVAARRGEDVVVVVGDRPATDGAFARRLGVPFALVLSGVTGPSDLPVDPPAEVVAADLARLVDLAGPGARTAG